MSNLKNVVFCTTCKGRAQHLEKTLPANIENNLNAKFIILDYNSNDQLIPFLKSFHKSYYNSGRLVVYSFPQAGKFKMAHAKNMAHRCGILEGADILVNLDADNFTGPNFDSYIHAKFNIEKKVFLWSKMIPGVLPRGIHGRIAVSRDQFLNSGGYDEKYESWGPDDKDFNTRLRRLGYTGREIDPLFLMQGVAHNDKIRFKEYPEARVVGKEDVAEIHPSNTIANFGKVGLGVVYKNFDLSNQIFDPIPLTPLPTRIFGIGIHKTATTSLHTALTILGIDSAHWKNAHWAKAVYEEMINFGKSVTLEKSYAVCDLPITLLYKELDKAYPGSKFILTTRHEMKWLKSVRDHWDYNYNRFRASWDHDPFSHRLHVLLYGRKNFDSRVFLERFRKHNNDVKNYFKNRPEDLLTFNVDEGDGWEKICNFLKVPIPSVPYPNIDPVKA